ncbi:MAG TPA: outer membrane protein assembly factor BamD [Catalimonadaceae bacterium]|nr:outer membrane protein assembly factor BamD [Catalimonadaceae bacterium]HPI09493.1 outer membrane protein assembly factor BamD [Catalimonadaceae bacterium]
MAQLRIVLFFLLIIFSSCSKFSKLQKSDDLDVKREGAYAYYDKKDFYRASQLLEELIPLLKGTENAEKAEFLYAMCQYELRLLESSAFYFDYFLETYPRSIYAEEASYMVALSQFENSPSYYLDQGNTDKAILAIENFINKYPDSERRPKCQTMIDRLNEKLETKDFENARLFYQVMEYKSAIITLNNFAKDYPNSPEREQALYIRILAAFKLAKNSTDAKKPERFQQTIDFYTTFVDSFPKSKKLKELENVFDYSSRQLALAKKDSK